MFCGECCPICSPSAQSAKALDLTDSELLKTIARFGGARAQSPAEAERLERLCDFGYLARDVMQGTTAYHLTTRGSNKARAMVKRVEL